MCTCSTTAICVFRRHSSAHQGVRDFTYINDIIEGVTRVIDSPPTFKKSFPSLFKEGCPTGGVVKEYPKNEGEVVKKPKAQSSVPLAREIREANISTVPYKIYNIGNSSPMQLMDYITAIEKHLGKKAKKEFLPMQLGDVPKTEADMTDLVEDLGYKPDTPVSVGIERFVEWFKQYFKI